MRIKYIVSGVAIALSLSVGSAVAADQFATLDGVMVQPMDAVEMRQIKGKVISVDALFGVEPSPFAEGGLQSFVEAQLGGAPDLDVPPMGRGL